METTKQVTVTKIITDLPIKKGNNDGRRCLFLSPNAALQMPFFCEKPGGTPRGSNGGRRSYLACGLLEGEPLLGGEFLPEARHLRHPLVVRDVRQRRQLEQREQRVRVAATGTGRYLGGPVVTSGDRSLPRGTGRCLGGPVVASGDRSLPRGIGRCLGGPVVTSGDRSLLRGTGRCFGGPVVTSGDRSLPRGTGRCFGGPVVTSGDRSLPRGIGRCLGGPVVTSGDRSLLRGTGRCFGGPVVASGDRSLLRGTGCCLGGPVVASGDWSLLRGTGRYFTFGRPCLQPPTSLQRTPHHHHPSLLTPTPSTHGAGLSGFPSLRSLIFS